MENSKNLATGLRQSRAGMAGRDYYGEASKGLGVDASQQRSQQLRSTLRGTEQLLRGVEGSVAGRTQGSLLSEAQRQRMVNLERQPIADQFREQQGALSDEDAMLQSLLQQASQRAGLSFERDKTGLGSIQEQFGTVLGSENEAARRNLEKYLSNEQLRFSREELAQQAAIAAADRASRERLAAAERAAAQSYRPDFSWLSSLMGGGSGTGGKKTASTPRFFASESKPKGDFWSDTSRNINQGFSNIGKYGPLALLGGGSLWR